MAGMAGMAERQKEWQNGGMAEVATYVLFMVHANDNDDNDTLIFYITEPIYTPYSNTKLVFIEHKPGMIGHMFY